jgi:hypothetical protein
VAKVATKAAAKIFFETKEGARVPRDIVEIERSKTEFARIAAKEFDREQSLIKVFLLTGKWRMS